MQEKVHAIPRTPEMHFGNTMRQYVMLGSVTTDGSPLGLGPGLDALLSALAVTWSARLHTPIAVDDTDQ